MGYFYIDDSVHDQAGFIIGALIYSDEDLQENISKIIASHDFNPETFEFKSSANYSKEPEKSKVRDSLKQLILTQIKLGIVVIPREKRDQLGYECLKALKQFIESNAIEKPIKIFFDQGMFKSIDKVNALINQLNFEGCEFFLEEDSKKIKGIQIADLCAHTSSIQFKDHLGVINKKVKAGENSGYDPNDEIDLGFEMWATLRNSFFSKRLKQYVDDPIEDATVDVEPFGLYISEFSLNELSQSVRECFSRVYLGCIH